MVKRYMLPAFFLSGALAAAFPAEPRAAALGKAVEELAASDPQARDDFYRLAAEAYAVRNKTDLAIAVLEEYRGTGGNNVGIISRLGDLYSQGGAVDKAIEASEQVLKLNPADTSQYAKLAALQLRKGDADKAAAALDRAPEGAPGAGEAWARVAEVRAARGDGAKAEKALEKAIAAEPRSNYFKSLARLRAKSGTAQAEAVIADGRRRLPREDADLALVLADIFIERGDYKKAEQVLAPLLGKVGEDWRKHEIQHRLDNLKPLMAPAKPLAGGTTTQAGAAAGAKK